MITLTSQTELKAATGVGGVPLSGGGPVRASYFSHSVRRMRCQLGPFPAQAV